MEPHRPTDPRRSSVLALILATTAIGIMGNTLLAPAIPDILDDFGVGDAGAGLLIAATSLPGVFMAPLIGILADRYGRRQVLVPCLATFGAFGLAGAFAPTFAWLVVARFGMGLGAAGLSNMSIVLIGDFWQGTERTKLIGRNAAFLTLCLAIFPPLGGFITDAAGWRWAVAPQGLGLVVAYAAWRILDGSRPAIATTIGDQLRGLGPVVRAPQLMAIFIGGAVAFMLIFGTFLAVLPIHLRDQFDSPASVRGLFLAIPALTSTVIAFNLGRIRRRVGPRALLVSCSLLFGLGFLMISTTQLMAVVVLGCLVYGLGEGAMIPTLQDRAVAQAPDEHRGAVVAVFVGAARLGQTIGPLGAAALFGATSTFVALDVGVAIAVGLAVMFAIVLAHDPATTGYKRTSIRVGK